MENNINITSAQYMRNGLDNEIDIISATIDGTLMSVPLDPDNRHYSEILRQVEAGDLTIADAD